MILKKKKKIITKFEHTHFIIKKNSIINNLNLLKC